MSARNKKLNINLIIKEQAESFSEQLLSWALTYGRYIIILTQIIVLSVFFLRFKLDRDHTDLKESVSQKQALVESISELELEIRSVQATLSNISQITDGQMALTNVLNFLSENTPSDTTFLKLSLSNEKISFSVSARNLRSFNILLSRLQKPDKFTDITLEDIHREADGRIEFKINATINPKGFI